MIGQLTAQWTDALVNSPDQSAVMNVASWLSRATMDSIGEGSSDFYKPLTWQWSASLSRFWLPIWRPVQQGQWIYESIPRVNVCHPLDHTLAAANLIFRRSDTLGSPPRSALFIQTIFPVWLLQLRSKFSRARNLVHARHTEKLANTVTRQLVESKAAALLQGKGNKDILSLLGRYSFNPWWPSN